MMSHLKKLIWMLVLFNPTAHSAIISFDGVPSSWEIGTIKNITDSGYNVSATGQWFWISDGTAEFCVPDCPVKNSQYLMTQHAGNEPILVTSADGNSFNLMSFEYGERHITQAYAPQINVIGKSQDGEEITASFVLDGVNDGSGPLNDFQTAVLPEAFRNLVSIEFSTSGEGFSLDTIIVNPVPLPAAFWLFSTAIVGLIGILRNRNIVRDN